jgi:hypothetical protein
MASVLGDLIPHLSALLFGGLLSSFGLTALARRPGGRRVLGRINVWGITVFGILAVGGLVGGFFWLFAGIREGLGAESAIGSPMSYLLFGLVTGLPLSLPGVITAWSDARPEKVEARARKAKAATEQDRREFARNLVRQIEEFADVPRTISASLTGEDGTVLAFEGDLERKEGDKLVAALRGDLQANGFKRVEGEGPKGKWWSRV